MTSSCISWKESQSTWTTIYKSQGVKKWTLISTRTTESKTTSVLCNIALYQTLAGSHEASFYIVYSESIESPFLN